mmetsp:Transcript_5746/g.16755  ORF Transcript_5746/g.16755 Transcript_5746/m.16755 type:complete len:270 (-) Transcript_5746:93-902(-)
MVGSYLATAAGLVGQPVHGGRVARLGAGEGGGAHHLHAHGAVEQPGGGEGGHGHVVGLVDVRELDREEAVHDGECGVALVLRPRPHLAAALDAPCRVLDEYGGHGGAVAHLLGKELGDALVPLRLPEACKRLANDGIVRLLDEAVGIVVAPPRAVPPEDLKEALEGVYDGWCLEKEVHVYAAVRELLEQGPALEEARRDEDLGQILARAEFAQQMRVQAGLRGAAQALAAQWVLILLRHRLCHGHGDPARLQPEARALALLGLEELPCL